MEGFGRLRQARASVLALACLAFARAGSAQAAEAVATLTVPGDSEAVLSSIVSLPVAAIRVASGTPVAKEAILVEMNKEKLQRELEGLKKELEHVKSEQRYRASERDLGGAGAGSTMFGGGGNSIQANLAMAEGDLTRDMLEVQTKLATADVRAPQDGYVVKHFLAAGAPARKRKPALTFVEARKTRVQVSVGGGEYRPGELVVVASADSSSRFRATVAESSPTPAGLSLLLQPEELPFLSLGAPTEVTVSGVK